MRSEYELVKERLQHESLLSKAIEDLIIADVHRSFAGNKAISHSAMQNVLRAYAQANRKVEYCQGMNFIVGFIYLIMQDEARTFKFFSRLIEEYKMGELFTQDVPLLKRYFYQIDRLFYIHCPELSESFRSEGVSASYFTSAWFMTLFTHSLQYSKEGSPSPVLLAIWDAFLLHGWKALFKVGLYIIKELRTNLLDAKFDDLMLTLGSLPRSELMQGEESGRRLRAFLPAVKVTNSTLAQLAAEYEQEYESIRASLGTSPKHVHG